MNDKALQVLELSSSGRLDGSVTRQLTADLIAALEDRHGSLDITRRNLGAGVPFVNDAWIGANFTAEENRTQKQRDMIPRVGLTFRYTENGPVGLVAGKKVYLAVATGGVEVGSPMDFATPYLRHALSFIGITDVEIVGAKHD